MNAKQTTTIGVLVALVAMSALAPTAQATTRALTDNLLNALEPNFDCKLPYQTQWTNLRTTTCYPRIPIVNGYEDAGVCAATTATGPFNDRCLDVTYFNYYGVLVMSDPNDEIAPLFFRFIYPGLADFAGVFGDWRDCEGNSFVDDRTKADNGVPVPACNPVDEYAPVVDLCDAFNWNDPDCDGTTGRQTVFFEVPWPLPVVTVNCGGVNEPPCPPTTAPLVNLLVDQGNALYDRPVTCGAADYDDRQQASDESADKPCLTYPPINNNLFLENYPVAPPGLGGAGGTWVPDDNNLAPEEILTCIVWYASGANPPPPGSGCEQLGDQWADHVELVNTYLPDYLDTPGRPVANTPPNNEEPPLTYFDYCPTGNEAEPQRCGYNGVDALSIHNLIAFPAGSFPAGVVTVAYVANANDIDQFGNQVDNVNAFWTLKGDWANAHTYEDFDYWNALTDVLKPKQ